MNRKTPKQQPEREVHLNVNVPQPVHEALAVWASRRATSVRALVRELLVQRLREIGILEDGPADGTAS
jgi:predicted HicB family RNase H-like nuclease